MQVHYDEGIANRIDLEPCAGIREDVGEASAGAANAGALDRARAAAILATLVPVKIPCRTR